MPLGKQHEKVNIVFLMIFLFFSCFIGSFSFDFAFFFIFGYLFGTFLCGPDLDTRSSIYMRWGILRFIWYPYRKFFPHRSIFTHWFVISDIIRLVYLALWLAPALLIVPAPIMERIFNLYNEHIFAFWFLPIGVIVSSMIHISADVIVSTVKQIFR